MHNAFVQLSTKKKTIFLFIVWVNLFFLTKHSVKKVRLTDLDIGIDTNFKEWVLYRL